MNHKEAFHSTYFSNDISCEASFTFSWCIAPRSNRTPGRSKHRQKMWSELAIIPSGKILASALVKSAGKQGSFAEWGVEANWNIPDGLALTRRLSRYRYQRSTRRIIFTGRVSRFDCCGAERKHENTAIGRVARTKSAAEHNRWLRGRWFPLRPADVSIRRLLVPASRFSRSGTPMRSTTQLHSYSFLTPARGFSFLFLLFHTEKRVAWLQLTERSPTRTLKKEWKTT